MIQFIKRTKLYFALSAIVILSGIFSIVNWGYRYSIDFTGGTNLDFQVSKPLSRAVIERDAKSLGIEIDREEIQGRRILLKTKAIDDKKQEALKNKLQQDGAGSVKILRAETVGPTLGKETVRKTIIAALIAIVGILLYMAYAFKGFTFAVAAIVALIHDFLVVMGTYSLLSHFFGAEFDTLFVTALLTTMSFSVHDTIIIFDKIREYKRTIGAGNIEEYANRALTETLIRSVNNSMTIIFMLLALLLLGGTTIKWFVAALLVGTITGVYSSPFIATPVWVWLEKRKKK